MTAHPGAYCSPAGSTDQTKTGTDMVCTVGKPGDRARWRRNGPAPARTPRGPRRAKPAAKSTTNSSTLPAVDTGIDPTKNSAPVPAPADETPKQPEHTTTLPPRSPEPIEWPNGGEGIDQGLMHFVGALGSLWNGLGDDKHLTVDGHALGNVIKDLGEGITLGNHGSQHAVDDLRRIRQQLPAGTHAARLVDNAIRRLDAPARPLPELPANTPQRLRDLVTKLNEIPLVRRGEDEGLSLGAPFHETDAVADIARRWANREFTPSRLESALMDITRRRHESMEGWSEIRGLFSTATRDIHAWGKRPD